MMLTVVRCFAIASLCLSVVCACESSPKSKREPAPRDPALEHADRPPTSPDQTSEVEAVPVVQRPSERSVRPPVKRSRDARVSIDLSDVATKGLISCGAITEEQIAEWFNRPSAGVDPFVGPMWDEVRTIRSDSADFGEFDLSQPTVDALASLGCSKPQSVSKVDRPTLLSSGVALEQCRREIEIAMLKLGWAAIRTQVTNGARATQLSINGVFLGALEEDQAPVWRRFLCAVPSHASDRATYVALSVDVPDPSTGMPVARWFRDILLTRGLESTVTMNIGEAPSPSISIKAGTQLSPGAVYAGDTIDLQTEATTGETIWILHWGINEVDSKNFKSAPRGSEVIPGLPGWLRTRSDARKVTLVGDTLLDASWGNIALIGRGAKLKWTPQFESTDAHVGVLVRNEDGFWGYADRPIAIADLRPAVWIMPVLPLDTDAALQVMDQFATNDDRTAMLLAETGSVVEVDRKQITPTNIYLTHLILSQLIFFASLGEAAGFDFRLDAFRDARFPLVDTSVDFGDGTPAEVIDGNTVRSVRLSHVFQNPGSFQVVVTTKDVMGFTRTHSTTVVVPEADAPVVPPSEVVPVIAARLRAQTSFERFQEATELFAKKAVKSCLAGIDSRGVAVSSIHEQSSLALLDLIDSALMRELLEKKQEAYEWNSVYLFGLAGRGFVNPTPGIDPSALSHAPVSMVDDNPLAPIHAAQIPFAQDQWLADATRAAKSRAERTESIAAEGVGRGIERVTIENPPATTIDVARVLFPPLVTPPLESVDTVLEYKLKRAEVSLKRAGVMLLRTARIFAFVRLVDRETAQVRADTVIDINYTDLITEAESDWGSLPWNSYPEGFLLKTDDATDASRARP